MKQIIFIIVMLIGIAKSFAQEVQIDNGNHPDFQTEITRIMGNLDMSPVTSSILLDKGFPFIEMSNYQGTNTLADSNLLDINDFGSIYATLYGASLDPVQPCLPTPAQAYMGATQQHSTNAPIPITGLLFRYEQFKQNAIKDRLLEWQGDKLADVPNPPTSPYQTQNAFAATPIVNYSDKREVVFSLPSNLFHYNMGMTYALEIDFDDARGFHSYTVGQGDIPVLYSGEGLKKIKFRVRLANNTILNCHALFEIVLPDPSRSFQENPDITLADITLSSSTNGATLRGFSNCKDGKIRKPLIWVEGFNPTTTISGFDLDFNWMKKKFKNFNSFTYGNVLWEHLSDEGYDLIYVDFFDGAGDLRENSKVVQAVIRAVNAAKIGNEPIVILGESMGGVLSKHALRTMERAGEAHNCRLFFAFDSPLRGANVPIGLQHMAEQFINLKAGFFFSIKDFVPSLQELENILHSLAAKQMLSHHVSGFSAHNSFYSELAGLGELANCRQVCISNGSENGNTAAARQMINMTQPLLSINSNVSKFLKKSGTTPGFVAGLLKVLGVITGTKAKVKLEVNAIPEVNTSFLTIYKGKIVVKLLSHVIPLVYSEIKVEVKNFRALDNAPGGINGQDLDPDVVTLINNAGGNVQDPFMFCFVPTVSALDLRNPEVGNPFLNVSNYNQMVSSATTRARAIVASNLANFSTFGVNQENQFHISFTNRNGIFFLRELTNEPNRVVNTGLLFSTYNFGATDAPPSNNYPFSSTTKVINRNQNLNSSSTNIWINRNGNLEFPFSSLYPACRTNATFGVFVRKNRCGNAKTVINVSNGGSLLLGEQAVNNTGNLTLEEESEIINTTGGNLTLENNSVLTITSGTKLEQTGGLITLRQNSKIIVQNGGIFNITGGTLTLNSDSKIIVKNGGVMNIDAGLQNLINNGQIIVEEYGTLNVLNTSNIKMSNTSKIVIEDKGKLFLKRAINTPQNIILTGDGGNLAPIIIKGSLTTEVVIQMKDAAVLQFEKTNKLFVNMSKFHVECAAYQNIHTYPNMIVLMPDTKLKIPDVDLYLHRGTIYYNSRSQIEMPYKKKVDCIGIRFQGSPTGVGSKGLTGGYPRRLSISSCYFTDVNMCVDVLYPSGVLPVSPYIHIANTKMEKYTTCGVHLVNSSYVIMASCSLKSNYTNDGLGECVIFGKESRDAPAIVVNNSENPATQYPSAVPSTVALYDVTIEGEASHWSSAYNDASQYYDRTKNHANQYIDETNADDSPGQTNITKWGHGAFSYLVEYRPYYI